MTVSGGWHWAPGSFLTELAPQTAGALLGLGTRRRYPAGRMLLREGEQTDHVLVLLRGAVKVTMIADDVDTLLAIRFAGDIVGETAGLTGRRRTATVVACGEVSASLVSLLDFERFLLRYPDAAVRVAAMISERLRWANARRADFLAHSGEVRLVRLLMDLAERCGRRTADGLLIDVPLTQRELATMIGVSHATMQNTIRDLKKRGLIQTGYRRITIVNEAEMAALRQV